MLNTRFDLNALVFTEAMNPRDVAAAIFPKAVLDGIVVKHRVAIDCAIGEICGVVPVTFLEKSGQGQCLLVTDFVVDARRKVVAPTP